MTTGIKLCAKVRACVKRVVACVNSLEGNELYAAVGGQLMRRKHLCRQQLLIVRHIVRQRNTTSQGVRRPSWQIRPMPCVDAEVLFRR